MAPLWLLEMAGAALAVGGANASPLPSGVLVGNSASPQEQYAAEDLQAHLGNITGRVVPLCAVPSSCFDSSKAWWAVGHGAAAAVGVDPSTLRGLGLEGFVVRLTTGHSGSVAVTGGPMSARGAMYAVNRVLRALGVEWYAHDVCRLPASLPSTLPPALADARVVPSLEYRQISNFQDIDTAADERYARFEVHLGMNLGSTALRTDQRFGGVVQYASPPGFVHTSYAVLAYPNAPGRQPPPSLWAEHREWFWPQQDNASAVYGQLCWSNSSLQQFLIAQVRRILTDNPNATIISVSQNDNGLYCQTPEELAIIKEEGTPGGALFRAVNVIADAIGADFPAVAVDTLAYQWSRPAPAKTIPRPNVIIRLCSIECNFGKPLTDASNAPFQKDIVDWSKISNRTYVWNYVTNFQMYLGPFPNWWALGPNVQFYKAHGVLGIYEEGTHDGPGGDMSELKDFVLGRMLWDPTLNASALIDDFLANYFGAAAPHIMSYMRAMHDSVVATGFYMHESFDAVTCNFTTPDAVLAGASAFADAAKAVAGDAGAAGRVLEASMAIYWVVMPRWGELTAHAAAKGVPWPLEATLEEAFDGTFVRAYNWTTARYGHPPVFHEARGPGNLTALRKQLMPH